MPESYPQTFSVCRVCDEGVDPLDVPQVACGHDLRTHAVGKSVDFVARRDYDALERMFRSVCETAMDLLKDAPGAAAMFDPDYNLLQAGLQDD